ncbi:nucleoprotein/polynucleotide-associated enzyme [Escherichia coli]|uniref:Nucleoprotein/polynucleotide-associated enzyme n=1 Tax=Escherichia coli TaxID=562 RepID=A0A376MS00_ECOLX|nr:nucleoprotein/polynucleotide-associated enzyme [Escherichia coli]
MAKLTLQEQLLKAGLVTSKKRRRSRETAKKSRVQAREARAAVEETKRHSLSVINSLASSKTSGVGERI